MLTPDPFESLYFSTTVNCHFLVLVEKKFKITLLGASLKKKIPLGSICMRTVFYLSETFVSALPTLVGPSLKVTASLLWPSAALRNVTLRCSSCCRFCKVFPSVIYDLLSLVRSKVAVEVLFSFWSFG